MLVFIALINVTLLRIVHQVSLSAFSKHLDGWWRFWSFVILLITENHNIDFSVVWISVTSKRATFKDPRNTLADLWFHSWRPYELRRVWINYRPIWATFIGFAYKHSPSLLRTPSVTFSRRTLLLPLNPCHRPMRTHHLPCFILLNWTSDLRLFNSLLEFCPACVLPLCLCSFPPLPPLPLFYCIGQMEDYHKPDQQTVQALRNIAARLRINSIKATTAAGSGWDETAGRLNTDLLIGAAL